VLFTIDYALRVFTSDYKMGVLSYKAYIYYALTPMAIVDLLSITPVFSFFFPNSTFVSLFRVFRVLRVLKLVRYSKTMVTVTNVLRKVKSQLTAVLVLVVAYILATALIIFQVEPDLFDDFFEAVYWASVSITTIGYGDISPVSVWGRAITILSALVGMAVIALPSGIITAAYMEEIHKKKGAHEL
jgi:voltage-gated potassium channel